MSGLKCVKVLTVNWSANIYTFSIYLLFENDKTIHVASVTITYLALRCFHLWNAQILLVLLQGSGRFKGGQGILAQEESRTSTEDPGHLLACMAAIVITYLQVGCIHQYPLPPRLKWCLGSPALHIKRETHTTYSCICTENCQSPQRQIIKVFALYGRCWSCNRVSLTFGW